MAKIIENVEGTILEVGKKILLEEGYEKMTLRLVASKCNIATGTIYNYFSSKDVLVAKIMWGDWSSLISKLIPILENVNDVTSGIESIFMMLKRYTSIYEKAWKDYGGSYVLINQRHQILIKQLSDLIEKLFIKFNILNFNNLTIFLSEIILSAGIRDDVSFETIKPFVEKLLN